MLCNNNNWWLPIHDIVETVVHNFILYIRIDWREKEKFEILIELNINVNIIKYVFLYVFI